MEKFSFFFVLLALFFVPSFFWSQGENSISHVIEVQSLDKNFGDVISFDDFRLKAFSFWYSEKMVSDFGYELPIVSGMKLVVLDVSIMNTSKASKIFFPDKNLVLEDALGYKYTVYSDALMYLTNVLEANEFAPNTPKNGMLIYMVPKDSAGLKLKVFSGEKDVAIINLK